MSGYASQILVPPPTLSITCCLYKQSSLVLLQSPALLKAAGLFQERRGQNKPTKAEIVIPARICWFTTALPLALSWLDASRTLQNRLV